MDVDLTPLETGLLNVWLGPDSTDNQVKQTALELRHSLVARGVTLAWSRGTLPPPSDGSKVPSLDN
jgi:hypothetical protein